MAQLITSFITDSVMGKYRLRVHDVTATNTSGYLDTGLKRVTWAFHTARSAATNIGNLKENAYEVGTAAAGIIALSGVTDGDVYRVVSFGPS